MIPPRVFVVLNGLSLPDLLHALAVIVNLILGQVDSLIS
jgi:hypothetical protein